MIMRVWIILISVVMTLFAAGSYSAQSGTPELAFRIGRQVGKIQAKSLNEASGIVASRKNPGVLWIHNDSGNSATVYALNTEGKLLQTCRIEGAHNRDWEDIAIGPGPDKKLDYLYIGDIGDNSARHSSIIIYRVPEPKVDPNGPPTEMEIGPAEKIEMVYPDGPKDAETLMVDPDNGDIYIVSKREIFCRVFRAAAADLAQKPVRLSQVGILPWTLAVGGDISTDGRFVIVRSLTHASIWVRQKDQPLWKVFTQPPLNIKLMPEPQGEAICFDAEGRGFFTTSEKAHQPIYYYARSDESNKSGD
jgi:hypothetical protein